MNIPVRLPSFLVLVLFLCFGSNLVGSTVVPENPPRVKADGQRSTCQWDAAGRTLASRFESADEGRVRLLVDERGARYPNCSFAIKRKDSVFHERIL